MLTTIWTWIQEWSDIPRRFAVTCATCHQAFSWSSWLTASSKASSLRFPRVGALIRAAFAVSAGDWGWSADSSFLLLVQNVDDFTSVAINAMITAAAASRYKTKTS